MHIFTVLEFLLWIDRRNLDTNLTFTGIFIFLHAYL